MDAKITNSNENKANPVNYSTQGFTGDPIDRAKIMTNDRQFSIRNSHAIILFDANYDVFTEDAMEQLDRSMEILHKCFTDDMRKTFHAKTYADQAIRYYP